MGKIISVVGNLGCGKTKLTQLLCQNGSFSPYLETPEERPFHLDFGKDLPRWALANQVDFFLFRSKQENLARKSNGIAVFDGGFDQDFHVYTRHIYNKGYLNQDEYDVCVRLYDFAREYLPPPDLVIRVLVDIPTLLQRRASRGRKTDYHVFNFQELTEFESILNEWLNYQSASPVKEFTFDRDYDSYANEINELALQINAL